MTTETPPLAATRAHAVDDTHTLTGEHARLLRDVVRRLAPVQALLETSAWPHAELGTLTTLLRTEVLRQVSDEEVHLYPHDASAPPFAELSADHVRLHRLVAQLEHAYAEPCSRPRLRALIDELLVTLRRHLADEQAVLAALQAVDTETPSVADLAAAHREWLPDDTPVLIELDTLPADRATDLCIERLLRLQPGQSAEVHARDDLALRAVGRWLRDFDRALFGLDEVTAGRDHVLRVSRRRADTPAGIGYPG